MSMSVIKAAALTTYGVSPDGRHVRIHVTDDAGAPAVLELPTPALNELMMTLPRMLREALQNQYQDPSLRLVHDMGDCQVEQAAGDDRLILTLRTPDGFEVSFAITSNGLADLIAATDLHSSEARSKLM